MVSTRMTVIAIKYKDDSDLTLAFNFENSEIGTTQRYSREKANI